MPYTCTIQVVIRHCLVRLQFAVSLFSLELIFLSLVLFILGSGVIKATQCRFTLGHCLMTTVLRVLYSHAIYMYHSSSHKAFGLVCVFSSATICCVHYQSGVFRCRSCFSRLWGLSRPPDVATHWAPVL